MKCLKCGAYVYSSDKFCRSCGATLNKETCKYGDNISNSVYDKTSCHEKQYNYSYEYSNKQEPKYNMSATNADQYDYSSKYSFDYSKFDYANRPNDSGGDDKYLKAYVEPNYEAIKKAKFSIPTLIFGPWYLLYRKLWGYALAIIIVSIAATILLSSDLADAVNAIINIALAFKFQSIYLKKAEEHVENIKQQNLDKSTSELLEVCKKKGGTSLAAPIVMSVVALFIIFVIAGIYAADEIISEISEESEVVEEVESGLTYTVPTGFTLTYENGDYKRYSYTTTDSHLCSLTIDKAALLSIYTDEAAYLERHVITTDENTSLSAVTPITFNGTEWKYMHLETTTRSETQYALKTTNEIYVIKTYDYKTNNVTNSECNTKYSEFLNTLKLETN